METCSSFRGTSCRCTKDRQCRWIGIRPKGLGDRLISRQFQPELALIGERCPFVDFPFEFSSTGIDFESKVVGAVDDFVAVRAVILRFLTGLLLFDRALLVSDPESVFSSMPSSSSTGVCNAAPFFLADRVTGPKYPSLVESLASDGVGDGEITLGVAGIASAE